MEDEGKISEGVDIRIVIVNIFRQFRCVEEIKTKSPSNLKSLSTKFEEKENNFIIE